MPNSEPLAFGAFAGLWCGALPPPLLTLAALATGAEEPPAGALSFSKPHSCGCGALLTLRVAGLRESFALVVFGFGTAVFAGVAVGVRVAAAKTVGTGVFTGGGGFGARWCLRATGGFGFGLASAWWAMIGAGGSAPVAMHAAPAPTLPRHTLTSVAAGPRRPVEAAYIRSARSKIRANQPIGSSSPSRRGREKRMSRTVARQDEQWRRCGRSATTWALVARPAASASSAS